MDKLNISTGTIVRTICLVLALVNQVLVFTGHSVLPIEDSTVEIIVTNVATVVAAVAGLVAMRLACKPFREYD